MRCLRLISSNEYERVYTLNCGESLEGIDKDSIIVEEGKEPLDKLEEMFPGCSDKDRGLYSDYGVLVHPCSKATDVYTLDQEVAVNGFVYIGGDQAQDLIAELKASGFADSNNGTKSVSVFYNGFILKCIHSRNFYHALLRSYKDKFLVCKDAVRVSQIVKRRENVKKRKPVKRKPRLTVSYLCLYAYMLKNTFWSKMGIDSLISSCMNGAAYVSISSSSMSEIIHAIDRIHKFIKKHKIKITKKSARSFKDMPELIIKHIKRKDAKDTKHPSYYWKNERSVLMSVRRMILNRIG